MPAQLDVSDLPARKVLAAALQPLTPPGWTWVDHDAPADDSNRTRARLSQRTIEPSDTGDRLAQFVSFVATITVPSLDGLAAAELKLDDEIDEFLHALSVAGIPWSKADKGQYGDENKRLGYQVDIRIRTTKRKAK